MIQLRHTKLDVLALFWSVEQKKKKKKKNFLLLLRDQIEIHVRIYIEMIYRIHGICRYFHSYSGISLLCVPFSYHTVGQFRFVVIKLIK